MEQYLKERLFGAAILIALGVIFLPILFEERISGSTERREPMTNWAFNEDVGEELQPELSQNPADFTTVFEQLRQEEIKQNLKQEKIAVAALKPASQTSSKEIAKEVLKEEVKTIISVPVSEPVLAVVTSVPAVAELKTAPVVVVPPPVLATPVPPPVAPVSEAKLAAKQAWSIQLGSFSNRANAEQLVQTLKKAGFKAYAVHSTGKQGAYMKVLVGPEFDEKEAASLVSTLEKRFKLKGMLVRYQPGVI